jgi:hypothetical protein
VLGLVARHLLLSFTRFKRFHMATSHCRAATAPLDCSGDADDTEFAQKVDETFEYVRNYPKIEAELAPLSPFPYMY